MINNLKEYMKKSNKEIKNKLLMKINVEYPENKILIDSLYLPDYKNNIFNTIKECLTFITSYNFDCSLIESKIYNLINNINPKSLSQIYTYINELILKLEYIRKNNIKEKDKVSSMINKLYKVESEYKNIENLLLSKIIVVNGDGAIGKTHLLTKLSDDLFELDIPNLIIYGQSIFDFDKYLDIISSKLDIGNFLDYFDSYCNEKGVPFVIIFDAINECRQTQLDVLKKLELLKKYRNIKIIISYRNGDIDKELFDALSLYPNIRLYGFSDIIEAAVKFSEYYKIDINNILETDFSNNPLILKIFCEEFSEKGTQKGERGYNSATFIFERYFIRVGDIISKELAIKNQKGESVRGISLWNTLAKDIAKKMVQEYRQYLFNFEIIDIINNMNLNINSNKLLDKLVIHHLLERYNTYVNNERKKVYKFSFQKLSDFLIIRYILDSKSQFETYEEFFLKDYVIDFLKNNRSLLETLSEHIPIRMNGKEIYEIYTKEQFYDFLNTYIRSLRYRSDISFKGDIYQKTKSIIKYIKANKKEINYDDWLITIASCSIVDYHPLNCRNYFTPLLSKMSNSNRDIYLYDYLNCEYVRTRIISLCKIPYYSNLELLKRSFKINLCQLYFWMLGVWDREIRDKATKSLTIMLKSDLSIIDDLLDIFVKVNDQYIKERFLSSVFSSHKLNDDKKLLYNHYKKIRRILLKNKVSNIRIRYYFMQLQNLCYDMGLYKVKKNIKNILPIPKLDLIEVPHYEYNKKFSQLTKYSSIKFSLSDMGDFGHYIVEPVIKEFIYYNRNFEKNLKKDIIIFVNSLSNIQLKKLSNYTSVIHEKELLEIKNKANYNYFYYSKIEESRKNFIKSLTKKQEKTFDFIEIRKNSYSAKKIFEEIYFPSILNKMIKNGFNKKIEKIDNFNRKNRYYNRHDHLIERIGKKYQWVGYFELIGECYCNLKLKDNSFYDISDMICLDIDTLTINDINKEVYNFDLLYKNKLRLYNLSDDPQIFIQKSDNEKIIYTFFEIEYEGYKYYPIMIVQNIINKQNNNNCFFRLNTLYKINKAKKEINREILYDCSCGPHGYEYRYNLYEMISGIDELNNENNEDYNEEIFDYCWKEYYLESEYDCSNISLSPEGNNKSYYLLKSTIMKELELEYNYDGVYYNHEKELICIQSPFYDSESTYLYIRNDYYNRIIEKFDLIIGVYSEKTIGVFIMRKDDDFKRNKSYDALYTYDLNNNLSLRAIYKREEKKLQIYDSELI